MRNVRTLKLTPTAHSVLETDVFDHVEGVDPDDGYEPIRVAYRHTLDSAGHVNGGVIMATSTNADALASALNDLSNACDETAHGKGRRIDSNEKKFYRAAALSFATLASKARRA